jgi:hypothetical protein
MLFATYGAPAPQKSSNPLVIILGVCGGCVLLVIIGVGVLVATGYNMTKGLIGGAVKMPQTASTFVKAIETHNYTKAASLVDPSSSATLSSDKIQAIVEQAEKKYGPIQQTQYLPSQPLQQTLPGPSGRPQFIEYAYHIPLSFQKGSATGILKFRSEDMGSGQDVSKMKLSGNVTGFKIQGDSE